MKQSLQGHFLIAAPRLVDPNFFRSVVLLVQHNEQGALGLVLNQPLDISIKTAWEQVSEIPCNAEGMLHQAPCDGPLMVLHGDPKLGEIEVVEGVYFSAEKDALEKLALDSAAPIKFFVGYSGWTAGQLEAEMEEGGWMLLPARRDLVFSGDEEQWRDLKKLFNRANLPPGIDPKLIPDDPSVN